LKNRSIARFFTKSKVAFSKTEVLKKPHGKENIAKKARQIFNILDKKLFIMPLKQ
jgi:hypothetical protein